MLRIMMLLLALVALVVPVVATVQAGASELRITLESDSERERSMAAQLRDVLQKYDVDQWIFTHHVHIDERSVPRSHPVLTLHTRYLGDEHGLLAVFLHEQFHWIEGNRPEFTDASDAFAEAYPDAPVGSPEGARDLKSTYRHLLICDLEFQALSFLVGEGRAREVLSAKEYYTWIYDRVLNDPQVREIISDHGFRLNES